MFLGEREIALTSTEFNLLEFFLTHPGRAYSRDQLLEAVWGEQRFVTPRTVDVHVRRLREQIEEQPDNPRYLTTVRGFGYRFEEAAVTGKIFLKLIAGVFCLLLLALVTVDYFATNVAKDNYIQNLTAATGGQGADAGADSAGAGDAWTPDARAAHGAGGRRTLTVVRADGKVLVDSEADAARMENHRTRPELIAGVSAERWSRTCGRAPRSVCRSCTWRCRCGGASAIRIAVPLSEINRQVSQIRGKILVSTALAFLPAILIAALLARYHLAPLCRRSWRTPANWRAATSARACRNRMRASSGNWRRTLNETAENLQQTVEQLQREHAELEKVERVRKDFVINVSHELRTPLASIQGYTETLIDGAIDDPDHNMRFLGIIRHNAERLARLTEDLLTLSRVEQKRQKFEFETHFGE